MWPCGRQMEKHETSAEKKRNESIFGGRMHTMVRPIAVAIVDAALHQCERFHLILNDILGIKIARAHQQQIAIRANVSNDIFATFAFVLCGLLPQMLHSPTRHTIHFCFPRKPFVCAYR